MAFTILFLRSGKAYVLFNDDCTVRDEWFIKWSSELREKMIMIEMSEVQEEQLEEKLFMLAQGS
jgi:hypothetical protein